MIYKLPIFKKSFPLEGELSLELEVGIDPDTALTYIHLSQINSAGSPHF